MVSRRKFFAIFLMMAMLLFLFQFSQVMRESWNYYTNNEYAVEELPTADMRWTQDETTSMQTGSVSGVLFVGDPYSEIGNTVTQWCTYKKYKLRCEPQLIRFSSVTKIPKMVVIDGAAVDVGAYLYNLNTYMQYGVPIVFISLPDVATIRSSYRLRDILSISNIPADKVKVEGVRLFDGYLLGGEAIYQAQNVKEEKELQDLQLEIPWYVTNIGSKTYMVGMMNEKVYEREKFPRIMWRSNKSKDSVFAVNGDYAKGELGYGILDICLYEMSDYAIYPVVNAQNTLIVDFPDFSGADAESVSALYSRDAQEVQQDIFWPSIYSMITKNNLKPTCFFMTQYDAQTTPEVGGEQVNFYLQQLNEVGAESGRSMHYDDSLTLEDKISVDSRFYENTECPYEFRAAYLDEIDLDTVDEWEASGSRTGITTISGPVRKDIEPLSYLGDDVTLQAVTHEAPDYTYKENLRIRSLMTSIGYTNMLVDFHRVLWPEGPDDSWEVYFDKVYSNISTYWSGFQLYDQTTLSQSDARVRTFLNLDYTERRSGNTIFVVVGNGENDCWFLLRTHGETIDSVQNGEYRMLEKDAYLIHVEGSTVAIAMKDGDEILHYHGPFGR